MRQRAVDQARTALELQKKFAGSQQSGVQLLNKADEKKLKGIVNDELNESLRLIFREEVVMNLCRLVPLYPFDRHIGTYI